MKSLYYKLVDKTPVPIAPLNPDDSTSVDNFAGAWDIKNRRVAETRLTKDIYISTVFLVLDHSFSRSGPPALFESMIFSGKRDGYQKRYSTWEEAEAGHKMAVDIAFRALDKRVRSRIKRFEKRNKKQNKQ